MTITMEFDAPYVAEQLRFLRKVKKLTQENVADACNLSTRTIEKIESGRHRPNDQTIRSLCRGLGMDEAYFVESSPAEVERQKAAALKALRTTAEVPTKIVRSAQDLMAIFGDEHALQIDLASVDDETLELAATLADLLTDWGDIWSDMPVSGRLDAARSMAAVCTDLERAGYLVHMGTYRAQQRIESGKRIVFRVLVVSVRRRTESENLCFAIVQLGDGLELPPEDMSPLVSEAKPDDRRRSSELG